MVSSLYAQNTQTNDTTLVTVLPDSTYDIRVFAPKSTSLFSKPFHRTRSPLAQIRTAVPKSEIKFDLASGTYLVTQTIDGVQVAPPMRLNLAELTAAAKESFLHESLSRLAQTANNRRNDKKGLIDFKFSVPGGKESVFTTIFGKPEVNLRVTGTANMNIGATVTQDENPAIPEDQRQRVDPTFEQNLKLNIQGGIGDKLTINTDWDTERPFDYQNRLRIVYTGYDDEIIKNIELGNVSIETGNSLVSGGQALFGIKSVAQLGALKLTSVISQKEGQGNSKSIDGGSTEESFQLDPTDFEDGRHFFIDYFSYDYYNEALADPNTPINLFNLNQIVVYKLNIGTQRNENFVQGIAISDLGVRKDGISERYLPPNTEDDTLDDEYLNDLRSSSLDNIDVASVANDLNIETQNVVKGIWIPLQKNLDYTVDLRLGTISLLNSSLQSNEALAIAFQNVSGNTIVEVGDIIPFGEQLVMLKLIRQQNLIPQSSTWPLTMRNVYSLGPSNISSDGFSFGLYFTGGTVPLENLPGLSTNLMQVLGLDRVNQNREATPDNLIDFSTGVLDGAGGKIYFPIREPFGEGLINAINSSTIQDKAETIEKWAYPEMYKQIQGLSRQDPKKNLYEMSGKIKGGTSGSFYLGYALVEGSVKVFANGVELQEGLDYEVDYSIGNVFVTNSRYLAKGQKIKVDYESNNIVQIQQTTFTGVRGEYEISDNIKLGATYFNLKDQPLTDKIRIGDEPINNSIYGFDAKAKFDAPWLTRFIDWLPLFETKAPSSISFNGEFAQLKPGVAQTNAVQAAIDKGRLYPDEEQGVSFIDEFEGAKTSFSFISPARWSLAAAPASILGYDANLENPNISLLSKIDRADLRSQFAWYNIPINVSSVLNIPRNRETRLIQVQDVFDRQTLQQDNFLNTIDIFYNPRERGVYNYNRDLKNLLENKPETTWGGMTTTLPQGLENLTLNNIEFIEFWVQPIVPDSILPLNGTANNGLINDYSGKIYIDLGSISEDVIPNNSSNNEDGLSQAGVSNLEPDQIGGIPPRSIKLRTSVDFDGQFSINSIEDEDVGLDGLSNDPGYGGFSEKEFFKDYVEAIKTQYGENSSVYQTIAADPSNDDYYYWAESALKDKSLQERFLRLFGFPEANSRTTGEKRAITNRPDAEGLIITPSPNNQDSYFQYEIDLNPADLSSLAISKNFITDITRDRNDGGNWYQVRIPLSEFKRRIGNIQDLQSVTHMRFWMSGYKRPFTMRFATFELVGSQWRKAETIGDASNISTTYFISTINVEENRNRRPVPYVSPTGAIRAINRTQQGNLLANEQALSMEVEDLRSGDLRMIRRNFAGGMNMINYSNLRMFVHSEGFSKRGELELIVRLGRDLDRDYYEYRQPLTPTDTSFFNNLPFNYESSLELEVEERVWLPDENSMNIVLSSFNALKQLRNLNNADISVTYYDSTLVRDAPAGTRIGIRGNPTLQNIAEIGIGVMNPSRLIADGGNPNSTVGRISIDATVWVNELRVSGFDNQEGWSANTSAQIQLADIGNVSGKFLTSTSGFGALSSRLGNRQRDDRVQYDVSTTFNAHKLIPEKYGWNLPIGFNYSNSTSTPQFLPREGDIRLSDFKSAVQSQGIPQVRKDSIINNKIREVQSVSNRYAITLSNFSKRNSESSILKYTIDNMNFNYSYSQDESRTVQEIYNRKWNFNSGISYSYTFKDISLARPFWFTENISFLGFLYDLQFGYLPSSITTSGTLTRNYVEWLRRPLDDTPLPIQQIHQYDFNQNFGFSYTFMTTIPVTFSSSSKYILNNAGERRTGTDLTQQFELVPTFESISNLIKVDSIKARKETYNENYGASWKPNLTKFSWLSWMNYSSSFRGNFRWQNSPQGSNQGATVGNGYTLDQSVSVKIQDLFKKVSFYDELKKADEKETRDRARIESAAKRAEEQKARLEAQRKKNPNLKAKEQTPSKVEETNDSDLLYYSRKLGLALFSFQNVDFSYKHGESSIQNGYAGGSSFFDSFTKPNEQGSFAPPLSYRIGLTRRLNEIIKNPFDNRSIVFNLNENYTDNVTFSTKLQPFKNVSVDLDWNFGWNSVNNKSITLGFENENQFEEDAIIGTQSGDYTSSTWSFGGNFEQFFRYQLQRGLDDYNTTTKVIDDANGNNDGLTILDRNSIQKDFVKTYMNGSGSGYGKNGFLPIPLPNWKINWSGLEEYFDFASDYISRISLNHSYSGTYRVGWNFNNQFGEILGPKSIYQGSQIQLASEIKSFEANTITVDRKFVPLIGLNITWKNNLSTRLQYDYSKLLSISATTPQLTEKTSKGFKFTGTWSKRGFRMPFFNKLRNTLDVSVSGSFYDESNFRRVYSQILANSLKSGIFSQNAADYEFIDPSNLSVQGDTRFKLTGLIGYQFSSMVKANFEYTYDHVIPKSTQTFERITQNIRFNVIISIRSN